jgi:hypothetical protein
MRKGYSFEYLAKQKLIKDFGKDNVIKIAIGSYIGDFWVVNNEGKILKIVECKSSHSKYRPSKKEKTQLKKQIEWCKLHNIDWELWLKEGRKLKILPSNKIEEMLEEAKICK